MTHDTDTTIGTKAPAPLPIEGQDAGAASLAALRRHAEARSGAVERKEKLHQVYIGTDRDDEFATALDACLDGLAMLGKDGSRFEGRGVAVLADSGAGKTTTIGRALKGHPLFAKAGVNAPGCLAVSVKCLGSCTLRVLGEMLLEASGYVGLKEGLRENVLWQMLRTRLKTLGIVCVHVDEVNNLLENSNADDHQRIVNNCKALINNPDWPVVLVISGTPMIGETFRMDTQLRRRIDWLRLPHLQSPHDNETLAAYVAALCRIADVASTPGSRRRSRRASCTRPTASSAPPRRSRSTRSNGRSTATRRSPWSTSPPPTPAARAATRRRTRSSPRRGGRPIRRWPWG